MGNEILDGIRDTVSSSSAVSSSSSRWDISMEDVSSSCPDSGLGEEISMEEMEKILEGYGGIWRDDKLRKLRKLRRLIKFRKLINAIATLEEKEKEKEKEEKEKEKEKEEKDRVKKEKEKLINAIATLEEKEKEKE